jgi:hypothetical protein
MNHAQSQRSGCAGISMETLLMMAILTSTPAARAFFETTAQTPLQRCAVADKHASKNQCADDKCAYSGSPI